MDFYYSKEMNLTLPQALSLEWLDVNHLGGYSSSTILNCNTRKYHGLLVSNLKDPAGKYVLLSQLDDILVQDSQEYPLSAHQYRGALQDGSFTYYKEFILNTHPCMIYQFGDTLLIKELLMINEEDTLLIKYKIINNNEDKDTKIRLRPLLAYRHFHTVAKENAQVQNEVVNCKNGNKIKPYPNMPDLFIQTDTAIDTLIQPVWYGNLEYEIEKQRGLESLEDLFSPFVLTLSPNKTKEMIVAFSTIEQQPHQLANKWKKEIQRRSAIAKKLSGDNFQKHLKKAALQFIQKNPRLDHGDLSIVAGYHWFSEWGRDTMMSLPGLMLNSHLEKECLAILTTFAKLEKQGLLPNFLADQPEQHAYNSVDTSLWFIFAIQQYYLKTENSRAIKHYLWPTMKNIFSNYKNGTLYNIKMRSDGLLYAGNKDTNLTWMDAMINNTPVTPRYGAAVEVNALWFNALCFMEKLAKKFKDPVLTEIAPLIEPLTQAFQQTFWDEQLGYLKDCVADDLQDTAIRPNQILAVSLPYSPLNKKMAKKVVTIVQEHLLTPYGLRTLSPQDPRYIPHYEGDMANRDQAYHNGTIWPWLLGHFGEALLRVTPQKRSAIEILMLCLNALKNHLYEKGIGCISELFDGNEPYHPRGCIHQAHNVGEILRLTYLINHS
jgi:predicted glycogen debranching enzyme